MRSEIIPEGDEFRHPLFVSPLPFLYKITYKNYKKKECSISYSSPHEIILNLSSFKEDDEITYISKPDNQELLTITVERFKFMIAESIYEVSHDQLELLYMRLLLTNRHSKAISDKGRFCQYDLALRNFLLTVKGGIDCHLAYENRKATLHFKYRRLSTIHLLTVILDWNEQHDIHINHINIPINTSNQGLLFESLRLCLRKSQFKIYNYDPQEEDNILPTVIDSEIIQVINQLIK